MDGGSVLWDYSATPRLVDVPVTALAHLCIPLEDAWNFDGVPLLGTCFPSPPDACPEDLDGNGEINFNDLLLLLAAWGNCPGCPEDIDGSGDVGFSDTLLLLAAWGTCS